MSVFPKELYDRVLANAFDCAASTLVDPSRQPGDPPVAATAPSQLLLVSSSFYALGRPYLYRRILILEPSHWITFFGEDGVLAPKTDASRERASLVHELVIDLAAGLPIDIDLSQPLEYAPAFFSPSLDASALVHLRHLCLLTQSPEARQHSLNQTGRNEWNVIRVAMKRVDKRDSSGFWDPYCPEWDENDEPWTEDEYYRTNWDMIELWQDELKSDFEMMREDALLHFLQSLLNLGVPPLISACFNDGADSTFFDLLLRYAEDDEMSLDYEAFSSLPTIAISFHLPWPQPCYSSTYGDKDLERTPQNLLDSRPDLRFLVRNLEDDKLKKRLRSTDEHNWSWIREDEDGVVIEKIVGELREYDEDEWED